LYIKGNGMGANTWEEEKQCLITELKKGAYDIDYLLEREHRTFIQKQKHKDLWTTEYPQQESHANLIWYCFGDRLKGVGALDVGTGKAGVFCHDYIERRFAAPLIGCDIFEVQVPLRWEAIRVSVLDIVKQFGASSFDYVQCIETMEHLDEGLQKQAVKNLVDTSRKFVLITSMGVYHHLGEQNAKTVEENPHLAYCGQPDIEMLLDFGFRVILPQGYQIIAWMEK
jgi:hypothetical protein